VYQNWLFHTNPKHQFHTQDTYINSLNPAVFFKLGFDTKGIKYKKKEKKKKSKIKPIRREEA